MLLRLRGTMCAHPLHSRNFGASWPRELIICLAWPSRSHILLFIWLQGVQISWGAVAGPLKIDQLQRVKASHRGGSRKKGLRCWKGKDQARRLTEAKWGSPHPHVALLIFAGLSRSPSLELPRRIKEKEQSLTATGCSYSGPFPQRPLGGFVE